MDTLRNKLEAWASSTFGEIRNNDIFDLKERVTPDKEGNRVRKITLFVKKKEEIQKEWMRGAVFQMWVAELKRIIGKFDAIRISSAEGNEWNFISGTVDKKPAEKFGKKYGYQFVAEIIKTEKGGSNANCADR